MLHDGLGAWRGLLLWYVLLSFSAQNEFELIFYLDTSCSQLIIDGKIGLKNDSQISHFSKNSIVFEDGSETQADVVICATGYGDVRELVRQLAGSEVSEKVNRIWGLNKEGELNSVWRWCGVPRMYFMMGPLALCRFHSNHLALRK